MLYEALTVGVFAAEGRGQSGVTVVEGWEERLRRCGGGSHGGDQQVRWYPHHRRYDQAQIVDELACCSLKREKRYTPQKSHINKNIGIVKMKMLKIKRGT